MPFSVFRTHQKKMLVVFGILAMVGFVLSDTANRWMNGGGVSSRDSVIADIDARPVHLSDLNQVRQERLIANRFMMMATFQNNVFGGVTRSELLDAMILKREADRLAIPETEDFARAWIKQNTFGMNAPYFESILAKFEPKISGEELLLTLARQARIAIARQELSLPMVTPLDVFRNYRDQTERSSFKVVPFAVDQFLTQVADPTELDVVTLYDKYKDVLNDPASPTPGFKIPRKVRVEYLAADAGQMAKTIKAKLPEDDIKAYYETKKTEYPMDLGLPTALFLNEPGLTPPRYLPYATQRDLMANALAMEKAREQIQVTFDTVRDQVIDKFSDDYKNKEDEIADRKKDGNSLDGLTLPKVEDLAGVAKKFGLTHEISPLLDRKEAERYSGIAGARTGNGQSRDGRTFVALMFDPKTRFYDGFELTDSMGQFYGEFFLVRKLDDIPAHVADLKDVRDQVVRAWKIDKARPLARKAAEEYAAKLKADGGQIKTLTVDNHPVITIESVTKLKAGMSIPPELMQQYRSQRLPATPARIEQIPEAGQPLIDALFDLKAGQVAVEPDKPQTAYYAMALDRREPVSYASVMGPSGLLTSYWSETQIDQTRKGYTEAMVRLREKAGLRLTILADDPERGDESVE